MVHRLACVSPSAEGAMAESFPVKHKQEADMHLKKQNMVDSQPSVLNKFICSVQ